MLCLLTLSCQALPPNANAGADKKLVVVVVVDQMKQEQLERYRSLYLEPEQGGFRRLSQFGIEHQRAFHDHFPTHTAVGHAAIATGALPSVHGVVGNRWKRLGDGKLSDAGLDPASALVGGKKGSPGYSPRDLTAPTLGDTLKQASNGRAKVVAVALKDRTAVLLGGPAADASLWYDEESGNWVTSRHYAPDGTLPPFVNEWNQERHPDKDFAKEWVPELLPTPLPASVSTNPDGVAGNYAALGDVFPHKIDGGHPEGPGEDFYLAWSHTPWGLRSTVDLALQSLDFYQLGKEGPTDLLYVGLATLDRVGHSFGPDSPEALETLLQVDREVAKLLAGLEQKVGLNNCLIVLTADHGVTPLAPRLQELGSAAGQIPATPFRSRLEARLAKQWSGYKLDITDPFIFLTTAAGKEADKPAMLEALKEEVLATEGILTVFDNSLLARGEHRGTTWESAAARSLFPGRSGDLSMIWRPNFQLGFATPGGTNHGTPWNDDSHVPLLMYGWPQRGPDSRTCAPRQIVSTICLTLGLTPPGGCDAPPLPWALKQP